jgi:transcription initiation factor IIE alpha subunit
MFEFRCPACEALAYSSVQAPSAHGCPSCGADLEEIGSARKLSPMNSSVVAVTAAEGLRAPG